MNQGIPVNENARSASGNTYMEALLHKLQNDVEGRKQPRRDFTPAMKVAGLVLFAAMLSYEIGARSVDSAAGWIARAETRASISGLRSEMDAQRGQIGIQAARLERLERAYELSSRYGIGADLAITIHDIALAEDVDPQIAFELVRVESRFNPRAVSPVGALGLTQLMPATAQILSPGISRQQIFERETNLRLGFRFFKSLLGKYDGDVRLALLAYNRGPATVDRLLAAGQDPSNGYARAIMSGRATVTD